MAPLPRRIPRIKRRRAGGGVERRGNPYTDGETALVSQEYDGSDGGGLIKLLPIALGQTGPAAAKVETVLVGLVPLALGFVAGFIGLGGFLQAVARERTRSGGKPCRE